MSLILVATVSGVLLERCRIARRTDVWGTPGRSEGPGRAEIADRNGRALLGLERRLHLDAETPLNRWLSGRDVLAVLVNYEYAFSYVLSAFILLFWLLFRRPDLYRWARSSFVWLNL